MQRPLGHFSPLVIRICKEYQNTAARRFSRSRSDASACFFVNLFMYLCYLFIYSFLTPLPPLRQRCAWWTAAPTDRASAVCVSARRAGRVQNASRGTVTHAASTTESAGMASVTATRAGRVNTAPSVRRTHSQRHTHTGTHALHKATNWAGKYDDGPTGKEGSLGVRQCVSTSRDVGATSAVWG